MSDARKCVLINKADHELTGGGGEVTVHTGKQTG